MTTLVFILIVIGVLVFISLLLPNDHRNGDHIRQIPPLPPPPHPYYPMPPYPSHYQEDFYWRLQEYEAQKRRTALFVTLLVVIVLFLWMYIHH